MTIELVGLSFLFFFAAMFFMVKGWVESAFRNAVFAAVQRTPGIRASEIAEALGCSQVRVRGVIRVLEDKGMLITVPDSGDRKVWIGPRAR